MEYDPYSKFNDEQSCEDVLANLALLSPGRFDFAVVDGNHEGSHLRKETALLRPLLREGGVLILDDVSDAWSEIKAEYDGLQTNGWSAVGGDGRVRILRRG
jgi:predicted O-methyltransferase YrrM